MGNPARGPLDPMDALRGPFGAGTVAAERARLRPLLERCLKQGEQSAEHRVQDLAVMFAWDAILAALRRELGKESV